MRILSKFRDYYDAMAIYGIDYNLVYDRVPRTETVNLRVTSYQKYLEYKEMVPSELNYRYGRVNFYRNFLFVGGSFYTYFHAIKRVNTWTRQVEHEALLFNEEELNIFGYEYIGKDFLTQSRRDIYKNSYDNLITLFDTTPKVIKELAGKDPLWRLYNRYGAFYIDYNPNLKALGLSNFIPASKVHQNISMWLASHKEAPPIPHIDDLTMSEAKGFDRFSFRKSKK